MKRPLEGLKVADFSWFGAGPICALHIATYGATVIRVESETHIDSLRTIAPFPPGKTGYNVSGYFNNFNGGKYDLTLNMNSAEGPKVARRIIEWADVFLSNITPRVIERWGLTYDKLSEWNPKIIAAYQPMQGYDGPHRDFLGFGAVLTPITGYSYLSGFPDRKPVGVGTNYPDYVINPGHTLVAILAALHYRRRTGKGQLIECAQLESSVGPARPGDLRLHRQRGPGKPRRQPHRRGRAAQRLQVRFPSATAAARWTSAGSPSPASTMSSGGPWPPPSPRTGRATRSSRPTRRASRMRTSSTPT